VDGTRLGPRGKDAGSVNMEPYWRDPRGPQRVRSTFWGRTDGRRIVARGACQALLIISRTGPSGLKVGAAEEPLDLLVERAVAVDEAHRRLASLLEQRPIGTQASEAEIREARLPRSE
jgi:hypothetical protein